MKMSSNNAMVLALTGLVIASSQMANADAVCPSDIVKPFVGKWQGKALLVSAQDAQQQSGTRAEFVILDCQSFGATFNYLDGAGKVVRTVTFKAAIDPQEAGSFAILDGTVTDGSGVTEMTGSFRQIQEGTLLGTFFGSIGGKPAYMTELMNVTQPQGGPSHLVRTVQMFDSRGGNYLASRIVNDTQVQ